MKIIRSHLTILTVLILMVAFVIVLLFNSRPTTPLKSSHRRVATFQNEQYGYCASIQVDLDSGLASDLQVDVRRAGEKIQKVLNSTESFSLKEIQGVVIQEHNGNTIKIEDVGGIQVRFKKRSKKRAKKRGRECSVENP